MIIEKGGRARSERTIQEIKDLLKQELEGLTPEERVTLEIMLKELEGQAPEGGRGLISTIGSAEWKRTPVDMRTFVLDDYYLGKTCDNVYPKLLEDLGELFSGDYNEAIFTGCIDLNAIVQSSNGALNTIGEWIGNHGEVLGFTTEGTIPAKTGVAKHSGRLPVVRLKLANGMEQRLTPDHRVMAWRGSYEWVPVGELIPGDFVVRPRCVYTTPDSKLTTDEAKLLAYWCTDGSSSEKRSLFCDGNPATSLEVVELLRRLGFSGVRAPKGEHCWEVYVEENKRSGFYEWLHLHNGDLKTADVIVPDAVCRAPNDVVAAFLNRVWAAEGCVYTNHEVSPPRFTLGMTSERFIRQVQLLLLRFDVQSRVHFTPQYDKRTGKTTETWHLAVSGVSNLRRMLGALGPILGKEDKCSKLASYCVGRQSNTNVDVLPLFRKELSQQMTKNGITRFAGSKWWRLAMGGASHISRELFDQWLEEFGNTDLGKRLSSQFPRGFCFEAVTEVSPDGELEVGDICDVEAVSSFISNGIYSHNSIGWGKTYIASIGVCRVLYELSCMVDPHTSFGLGRGSDISILALSVSESLATRVAFGNIATKISASPYFNEHFPFEQTKKELRFPTNIWVAARASSDTSALGLNAIGAILDECLHPDSKVLLSDGTTARAEDLCNAGTAEVATFDFAKNAAVSARAFFKFSTKQACFELTLDDGSTIRTSGNHPIAVRSGNVLGFIAMCDILPGQEVITYGQERRKTSGVAEEETFGDSEREGRSEEPVSWEEAHAGSQAKNGGCGSEAKVVSGTTSPALGEDEGALAIRNLRSGTERVSETPDGGRKAGTVGGLQDQVRCGTKPAPACINRSRQPYVGQAPLGGIQSQASRVTSREATHSGSESQDVSDSAGEADAHRTVQEYAFGSKQAAEGRFQAHRRIEAEDVGEECVEAEAGPVGLPRLRPHEQSGESGLPILVGTSGPRNLGRRPGRHWLFVREARGALYLAGALALDVAGLPSSAAWALRDRRSEAKGLSGKSQRESQNGRRSELLRGAQLGVRGLGRALSVASVVSKRHLGVFTTCDVVVPGYEVFVADGALVHNTNFMPKTVSQQAGGQPWGHYDHAETLYNTVKRRMTSRFERHGKLPGMLFVVSSKKTLDDFTAKRVRESKNNPHVFVRDYALWDIKPEDYYSAEKFYVVCGNEQTPSRILPDDEVEKVSKTLPEGATLIEVPEDFRPDFERDLEGSIRDLAGVSTLAINPFIPRREKIQEAIDERKHPFSTLVYDRAVGGQFQWGMLVQDFKEREFGVEIVKKRPIINPRALRHIHIDPALRGDSAGFCMAHVAGWKDVERNSEDGSRYTERAPVYVVDVLLKIVPPPGGEIVLGDIRRLIYELSSHGYTITSVTLDQFQSADMLQQLSQRGYNAQLQSVDITPDPYENLKTALYENRLRYYNYPPLIQELQTLEDNRSGRRRKIDHPPRGCFTGDTRVSLLDGTLPTFEELAKRYPGGAKFPVYSMGPKGVCVGWGRDPRISKKVTELVEVTLDNYQVVRCTPDHLFMTLGGEWVQAQNLNPAVRLMPLYRSRENKGGWSGYERVWCPKREERLLTHQLVANQFLGDRAQAHVHHKDEIKHNNHPDNLDILEKAAHLREHTLRRHQEDPGFVAALRSGHARYRAEGGNERSRQNILRLFEEGKLKRGRSRCVVEDCPRLADAKGLCGLHYQQMRRDRQRGERASTQKNHRVLAVKLVQEVADVWDITVDGLENFALASGVFVHNSKDVSDALAGALWTLSETRLSMPLPIMKGEKFSPDQELWMPEQISAAGGGNPGAGQHVDLPFPFLTSGRSWGGGGSGRY